MTRHALACALLMACGGPPDGSRPLTAWEASVAAQEGCTDPEARITVHTDPEAFRSGTAYCPPPDVPGTCSAGDPLVTSGQCPWGCAHGAFTRYRPEPWPVLLWSDWHPHFEVWHESYEGERGERLLRHEAGHCAHGRDHGHERGGEQ